MSFDENTKLKDQTFSKDPKEESLNIRSKEISIKHEFSEIDEEGDNENDNMVSFRIDKKDEKQEEKLEEKPNEGLLKEKASKENVSVNESDKKVAIKDPSFNSKNIKQADEASKHLSRNNSKPKNFREYEDDDEDSLLNKRVEEKEKRIFWTKEKIDNFRVKCKTVKEKILAKQTKDFNEVRAAILDKDAEKVKSIMLDDEFIDFYKLELKKCDILEYILLTGQPDLLLEILNNPFYSYFDYNYIFSFIQKIIKEKNGKTKENMEVIDNIIRNKLYDEKMNRLIIWLVGVIEFFNAFRLMVANHEDIANEGESFNNFVTDKDIKDYVQLDKNFYLILNQSLEFKMEDLAIAIVTFKQELNSPETIEIAITKRCMKFLQHIWEISNNDFKFDYKVGTLGHTIQNTLFAEFFKRKSMFINSRAYNKYFNKGEPPIKVSDLIEKLEALSFHSEILEITNWKYLDADEGLIEKLFSLNKFEEINILIWKREYNWILTKEHFKKVIEATECDLILFFLKISHCRVELNDHEIQKIIVHNYIANGNTMYYGAEMLGYIYKTRWDNNLTKDLCKNISKTIKKKDILNCHSPILTCLLLSEFLYQISDISIQNSSKCSNLAINLLKFSKSIQDANSDESYIKFLMTQRDTKGRTAFQIASENAFYKVLETNEIGTTIRKMWNGKTSHQGFFVASSLHRYLDNAALKTMDPFQNFETLEKNQSYFYQLAVWTDSCSLRYWPESLSTIILILIYNLYIFLLVNERMTMEPVSMHTGFIKFLLTVHTFWTTAIAFNLINKLVFCLHTKRKYLVDQWLVSEILLFLCTFTLYLDVSEIFGVDYKNPPYLVFFIRTGILAFNDALVWMRITGLLLTFRDIGPLLRMVYIMSVELVKYMMLFCLWIVCCAAIFTSMFANYSSQFKNFSFAVTVLFGGFLNNYSYDFTDYYMFGSILLISYITISGMICANLLIAVLSSMYNSLSLFVDASHRSVLLSYFRIYKWDKKYGYLIFLTTPLNLINIITYPISLFMKDEEREVGGVKVNPKVQYNDFLSKIYYVIYFIAILFIYFFYSFLIYPFCYVKGIAFAVGNELNSANPSVQSVKNVMKWICYGPFFLLWIIARDLIDIATNSYNRVETKRTEMTRIQQYIKAEDVIIFLQFCHSKTKEDQNDLHSLFMDYLSFESRKKAENNEQLREKSIYINKLNNAGKNGVKKKGLINNGLLMYKDEEDIGFTGKYVKKNLIIIEILENFLIDDGTDNYIVDIEKLKMLLPKTRNINKDYIKRLVHTDINSLNKAVNHMKQKQNVFIQIQMLDKIVDSTIRVNNEIDNDAKKIVKKKNVSMNNSDKDDESIISKELNEQLKDYEFYSDLQNLLMKITDELKETIKAKAMTLGKQETKDFS